MSEEKTNILKTLWEIDYQEIPVSPRVFFTSEYYFGDNANKLYPVWLNDLEEVLDPKNKICEWCITGAIGIGKSTVACASLMYKIYYLLCLKDPHSFFKLMSIQPITFMLFSIYKYKAQDIVYEKLNNMLNSSPYFRQKIHSRLNKLFSYDKDSDFALQIKLPNSIRIAVGSSAQHALSEDILGGILDEINFRNENAVEGEQKYLKTAFGVYNAVERRIKSRFYSEEVNPGLLCLVSSKRASQDFLEVYIEKVRNSPNVKVSSYNLWDVKKGYSDKKFYVLIDNAVERCRILDDSEVESVKQSGGNVMGIPMDFKKEFDTDLLSALRDIAGVSVEGEEFYIKSYEDLLDVFDKSRGDIVNGYKIKQFEAKEIKIGVKNKKEIIDYLDIDKLVLNNSPRYFPNINRVVHIDLSKNKDATGIAMGCLSKTKECLKTINNKQVKILLPFVWVDFVLRVRNFEKDEIDYDKIISFIKELRDIWKFRIIYVSYDGFQSVHSLQSLAKEGFSTGLYSVDKVYKDKSSAYDELLQMLLTKRISIPYNDFLIFELRNLVKIGTTRGWKYDHPDNASKDCADALAGMVGNLLTLWRENRIYCGAKELDDLLLFKQLHKINANKDDDSWVLEDYYKTH